VAVSLREQIRILIHCAKHGYFTPLELPDRFAQLAIRPGFFEYIGQISEEVVAGLRHMALNAPSHPEDTFFIRGICYSPDVTPDEIEQMDAAERVHHYWCCRALRDYFYPELPLPPFEQIVEIGSVMESAHIEGHVVLFGDFASWMIRANPVHCVTPNGERIVINVVSTNPVKHNHEGSSDQFEREYGRRALTLGKDAPGPERLPPGTTVWVDRTNVAEIPPPELPE
jgi:hypothetical protein